MTRRFTALVVFLLSAAAALSAQVTGTQYAVPPQIDVSQWRLELTGAGLGNPAALTYGELLELPPVKKREHLVCPGLFAYFADWEGVPLSSLSPR